jgi:hypothetical protein
MDIQKHIYLNNGIKLKISEGNGQSKEQAVKIISKYKDRLIEVENDFITFWLNDNRWLKIEQALIFDDEKKFDKITIHYFSDNSDESMKIFYFDITDCF